MRLRIADSFTSSLTRLEAQERAAVKRAAFDFLLVPRTPGLRLHRLVHSGNPRYWSVRVSRELRLILFRGEDELVLCRADHHDRAYAWAARRTSAPGGPPEAIEVVVEPLETRVRRPERLPGPPPSVPGIPVVRPQPEEARPTSPRQLRAWRRATGPLPTPGGARNGEMGGTAPAPLLHLLRFFAGAEASTPAGPRTEPGAAKCGSSPARPCWRRLAAPVLLLLAAALPLAPLLLAGGPARQVAVAVAAGAAFLGAVLLGGGLALRARRLGNEADEARRAAVAMEGATRELAGALDRLRRGERAGAPSNPPAGEVARAWAAVAALERFLALEAADIRSLADAQQEPGGRS